jgi:hypothetical protein
MRISHRYRFVFLSNPRTASRSIRRLLEDYSDVRSVDSTRTSKQSPFYHHMPASEVKRVFDDKGWDWYGYHRFCIVRNPFTRMVSLYHHYLNRRRRMGTHLTPIPRFKAMVKYKVLPRRTFSQYVMRPDRIRKIAMPLDDFAFDHDGTCLVDDILMFENLSEELPQYLQRIGIDVSAQQIPVLGASGIQGYGQYYDEQTRNLVKSLYQYEIERFGYRFESLE